MPIKLKQFHGAACMMSDEWDGVGGRDQVIENGTAQEQGLGAGRLDDGFAAGHSLKVLHVITGLNVGGAETMLTKLIQQQVKLAEPIHQEILSLMEPGQAAARLAGEPVPMYTLAMRQGVPSLSAAGRLVRLARSISPDLIVGWMHHGYLAAALAGVAAKDRPPVIWNVRHSLSDLTKEKALSRAVLRLASLMSGSAAAIIYNSRVAATQYEAFGFRGTRSVVIPNGFDCDVYRPRDNARDALQSAFGIDSSAIVVAMIARYHPMKNHLTLVEAVRLARQRGVDLHLLLVGQDMDVLPHPVIDAISRSIPLDRLTLSGQRSDVSEWLPGVDIVALSSAWGEGFPNVLGEAMASGVPCVATDVGDSRWIIGNAGRTVPAQDPNAMAGAIVELAQAGPAARRKIGAIGRARITANFSIGEIARQYSSLYSEVLQMSAKVRGTARRTAGGSWA